jgi:hypothetical protein
MKRFIAILILAAIAASPAKGAEPESFEFIGRFKSLPATMGCGVLYLGSTTIFVEAKNGKEISVVVPCLQDTTTRDSTGAQHSLSLDRTYRIKVSNIKPEGICCFVPAASLVYLTEIQEKQ